MSDESLRCVNCGHNAGYHGATFCTLRLGTIDPRPKCDCTKWADPREHARTALEADPQETERAEVCVHPGCGLPRHLHGAPPGEPPNPTRSTHRFKAPLGNPQ